MSADNLSEEERDFLTLIATTTQLGQEEKEIAAFFMTGFEVKLQMLEQEMTKNITEAGEAEAEVRSVDNIEAGTAELSHESCGNTEIDGVSDMVAAVDAAWKSPSNTFRAKSIAVEDTALADMCCASCGVAETDDIKLKDCDKCDLAQYCSDECQQNHRPFHEAVCFMRGIQLRDEILFTQPACSHLGDCPICCLPLPLDRKRFGVQTCCSQWVCTGCYRANHIREIKEGLKHRCPFCRELQPRSKEGAFRMYKKKVSVNDPVALRFAGIWSFDKGDYDSAFTHWKSAATLGDVEAHYALADLYEEGKGVEKDEKKRLFHLEEAAIAGHPEARFQIGLYENDRKRGDRAAKHFIIAANLGHDSSLEGIKRYYKLGHVSKDDFAAALRAHQAAADATKSEQRKMAEGFYGTTY